MLFFRGEGLRFLGPLIFDLRLMKTRTLDQKTLETISQLFFHGFAPFPRNLEKQEGA